MPSVTATCPNGPCRFAQSGGGGIDNWGALTLINTTVSDNVAGGGVTAQANGGGILGEAGSRLTLVNSTVKGNRVSVSAPNGRFAQGGGIYDFSGRALDVRGSTVSGNRAEAALAMPASVDVSAACAGICVGEGTVATIRGSVISSNVVSGSNTLGNGVFCGGGVSTGEGGSFVLDASTVSNNQVRASARSTSSTPGAFLACSGAIDVFASKIRISNSRIVGNAARASTTSGAVLVVAGAVSTVSGNALITNTVFSRNSGIAVSAKGSAIAYGGGIANGGVLELRQSKLTDNTARARARKAVAHGGGIFDGQIPDLDQPGQVKILRSAIARNTPDQCYEC